jgi:hypothetical protein
MTSKIDNTAQNSAKALLLEIARMILKELQEREETVRKIVAKLAISEVEYKKAITAEVIRGVAVEAQYASLLYTNCTPTVVKNTALQLLQKKLIRDQRIYGAN